MAEHAVMVKFNYGLPDLQRLYDIEDELATAINEAGVGEFDGHEIAINLSDGSLYLYGPNGDAILDLVKPLLASTPFMKAAQIIVRYGPAGEDVPEKRITLDP
jgi:hypothetical protein